MIIVTVAGNIGKDAETREVGNSSVTSFSIVGESGFGDKKASIWFSCSVWGKHGEAIKNFVRKGKKATVVGELTEREYDGKIYKEIKVYDLMLQDSKKGQEEPPPPVSKEEVPF